MTAIGRCRTAAHRALNSARSDHPIASLAIALLVAGAILVAYAGDMENGLIAYREGRYEAARAVLEPLADAGSEQAAVVIGRMYHFGEGVPVDDALAYRYLLDPANSGNAEAQFLLGTMFLYGDIVSADDVDSDTLAARWLVAAAVRGHADAQYILALLLFAGTGVEQDPNEALAWIRRAAESGHDEARRFLDHFPK